MMTAPKLPSLHRNGLLESMTWSRLTDQPSLGKAKAAFLELTESFMKPFCELLRPYGRTKLRETSLSVLGALELLKQSSYETKTDPKALKGVLSWFDSFHDLSIPQEVWLQCQLALIEGFTNVVRHAHEGLPAETPIEIAITVTTEYLDMKIWDRGPGFDFDAMLNRKLKTTNHDSEGGRGLRIMYRVADTVEYSKTIDRRNCLHIQKHFDDAG